MKEIIRTRVTPSLFQHPSSHSVLPDTNLKAFFIFILIALKILRQFTDSTFKSIMFNPKKWKKERKKKQTNRKTKANAFKQE